MAGVATAGAPGAAARVQRGKRRPRGDAEARAGLRRRRRRLRSQRAPRPLPGAAPPPHHVTHGPPRLNGRRQAAVGPTGRDRGRSRRQRLPPFPEGRVQRGSPGAGRWRDPEAHTVLLEAWALRGA